MISFLHPRQLCLFVLALFCCTQSEAVATLPAGGHNMLPADFLNRAKLVGENRQNASLRLTSVTNEDFSEAWEIIVNERNSDDRHVQLSVPLTGAIRQRDVLFIEFYARMLSSEDETGDAVARLFVEQNSSPWEKALWGMPWSVGSQWRLIRIATYASRPIGDTEAVLSLRVGRSKQALEVGGLRVYNFGSDVDMSALPPTTSVTYKGREADAPWRKAAAERIEKYRKADITIEVFDAEGAPVPDAEVSIEQTSHAFKFSSAIAAYLLETTDAEKAGSSTYRKIIPQMFNAVTFENDLKWPAWEQTSQRTMRAFEWLGEHGLLPVRGHVLLWPSWARTPADLRKLADDPEALRTRILAHVRQTLEATGTNVQDWDVVNEPQTHYDILNILGDGIMVDAYKLAKEIHPEGNLYLNEALHFGSSQKLKIFEEDALRLRSLGAPIDGLGFQCHYAWSLTAPEEIARVLDHFAGLGFTLQITEFDISVNDPELQADYLRDFYTVAFSNPAVDLIQMWGFWAGQHWRPSAALWDKDWTPRPSALAYQDLLFNQWWTTTSLNTDKQGIAKDRGFLGDYTIVASKDGKEVRAEISLPSQGTTVRLTLP